MLCCIIFLEIWGGVKSDFMSFFENYGHLGVEIFFFLSGYLIKLKYDRLSLEDYDYITFMKKRLITLYPMLIINLLICWYVYPEDYLINVVKTLFFIHSGYFRNPWDDSFIWDVGGAMWFLAPLVLCYTLYYFIVKYKNNDKENFLFPLLSVTGMTILDAGFNYPILNFCIARGLTGFFGGVIFSKISLNYGRKIKKVAKIVVSSVVLVVYFFQIYKGLIYNWSTMIISMTLFLMPCVIVLIQNVPFFRRSLENKIFMFVGNISNQIFFFHLPVEFIMRKLTGDREATFVFLCIDVVLVFSLSVIYKINEIRILKAFRNIIWEE